MPPLGRRQGCGWKDKSGGKGLREDENLREAQVTGEGVISGQTGVCSKDHKGAAPDSSEDGHGEGLDQSRRQWARGRRDLPHQS